MDIPKELLYAATPKVEAPIEKSSKYKQIIVIRSDLGMSVGKMCVQVAHASVGALNCARADFKHRWSADGSPVIVCQVDNEESLDRLAELANAYFIPYYVVSDAGLTEVEPGTKTCIGLGPASKKQLGKFTSNLKKL